MRQTDYSNNSTCVLEIKHYVNNETESFLFDASKEDYISEWISNNIGEQLHSLNGCPLFMELSSWANLHAGENEVEYSLDNYTDIDSSEWEIILWNREENN